MPKPPPPNELAPLARAVRALVHPGVTASATWPQRIARAMHALFRADATLVAEAGVGSAWSLHVEGVPEAGDAFRRVGPEIARHEAARDATYGLLVAAEARGELAVWTAEDIDRVTEGRFRRSRLYREVYEAHGLTYAVGMAVIGRQAEGRITLAYRRPLGQRALALARARLELLYPAYAAGLALRRLAGDAPAAGVLDPLADEPPDDATFQPHPPVVTTADGTATAESLVARYGLTRREAEVALLLAQRRTNAEVAALLGCAERTARHHTEQVLAKLGVPSRRAVAATLGAGA